MHLVFPCCFLFQFIVAILSSLLGTSFPVGPSSECQHMARTGGVGMHIPFFSFTSLFPAVSLFSNLSSPSSAAFLALLFLFGRPPKCQHMMRKGFRGGDTHCAFFAGNLLGVSSVFEEPRLRTFMGAGAVFLVWRVGGHRVGAVWCKKQAVWWVGSKCCGGWEASAVVVGSNRLTWQLMGPAFLIRTTKPGVGLY